MAAAEQDVWSGSTSQSIDAGHHALRALATLTGVLAAFALPRAMWIRQIVKIMRHGVTTHRVRCANGARHDDFRTLQSAASRCFALPASRLPIFLQPPRGHA